QRGHLPLKRCVAECELILLRLIPFRNSLLTSEVVGKFAEAGGIIGACHAVLRGLLQRVEGAVDGALRIGRDGGLVGWAQARIVGYALELRIQQAAGLLLLAEKLLVQRVDIGKLLVGQLTCLSLCTASHGMPPGGSKSWTTTSRAHAYTALC